MSIWLPSCFAKIKKVGLNYKFCAIANVQRRRSK
jgi:hypothetical protein